MRIYKTLTKLVDCASPQDSEGTILSPSGWESTRLGEKVTTSENAVSLEKDVWESQKLSHNKSAP